MAVFIKLSVLLLLTDELFQGGRSGKRTYYSRASCSDGYALEKVSYLLIKQHNYAKLETRSIKVQRLPVKPERKCRNGKVSQ